MILLYIHLIISAISCFLIVCASWEAAFQFKRRYPELTGSKTSVMGGISAVLRLILQCCIPIYNIVIFFTLLFKHEDIVEATILKVRLKREKERKISDKNEETCVSCGRTIPEGQQVCFICEKEAEQ